MGAGAGTAAHIALSARACGQLYVGARNTPWAWGHVRASTHMQHSTDAWCTCYALQAQECVHHFVGMGTGSKALILMDYFIF